MTALLASHRDLDFSVVGLYSPVPECGKSTLARALLQQSVCHCEIIPFARPLKSAAVGFIASLAGVTLAEAAHYVYVNKSEPVPGLRNLTGRVVLQKLGEAGRRMDPDLWVRQWEASALERLLDGFSVVADDVRRPNEAAAVLRCGGGEVWRLSRAEAEVNADPEVIADVSEGALEGWIFNRRFSNDGTTEELLDTVRADLSRNPFPCLA